MASGHRCHPWFPFSPLVLSVLPHCPPPDYGALPLFLGLPHCFGCPVTDCPGPVPFPSYPGLPLALASSLPYPVPPCVVPCVPVCFGCHGVRSAALVGPLHMLFLARPRCPRHC